MVGPWQVPVADCAVTATSYKDYVGEAMAMGERSPLALFDAPASGRMAIAETVTNLLGADAPTLRHIKLSANWMVAAGHGAEDAKLYATVKAVAEDLCPELGICIPVGKIRCPCARSGKSRVKPGVIPRRCLLLSRIAPVADIRQSITPELARNAGLCWS